VSKKQYHQLLLTKRPHILFGSSLRWAWETTVFMAGLLCTSTSTPDSETSTTTEMMTGDEQPGASSCIHMEVLTIISNTMLLAYYFHSGYSSSAASHIGNLLGYGDHKNAVTATRVCLLFVTCISCTVTTILISIRHQWGKLFSNDPLVHEMVAKAILVVSGYLICDASKKKKYIYMDFFFLICVALFVL
jgi:hypothetical protein